MLKYTQNKKEIDLNCLNNIQITSIFGMIFQILESNI